MNSTLNVRLIIDAVLLRWRLILLVLIITPTVAVIATRFHRPPYVASARLMIQDDRASTPFLDDLMVDLQVTSRLPVVRNVLRSRTVVEQILTQLGEIGTGSSTESVEAAIDRFQDQLEVQESGGGVIGIQVQGSTPGQAYQRLRLVMNTLLDEMLRPQREALDASVDFLSQQLDRIGGELADAEDRIRDFKEEHADELPEVFQGNLDRYITTLADLQQAQADLAVAQRRVTRSEQDLSNYVDLDDPRIQDLEDQLGEAQDRYDDLLRTYTEDHPEVVRARRHIQSLEEELQQAQANPTQPRIEDLERMADTRVEMSDSGDSRIVTNDMLTADLLTHRRAVEDVEELTQRVESLQAQRDELREEMRSFAGNEQELNELTREVDAKSDLHQNLLRRYQDALLTRELTLQNEASRVWVIEAPQMPLADNRPPAKGIAIKGFLAGLVLAGLLVFAAEYLDRSLRLPEEATEVAGVPTIVVLPRLDRSSEPPSA